MKKIPTYIVDSFTDEAFKGNPAGICIIEKDLPESKMLSIAKELNLSETAFVKETENKNTFTIRFFSTQMEIALCGHATLAAAKILFNQDIHLQKVNFITIGNINLTVQKIGELIQMEFPLYETENAKAPIALINALGITETKAIVYNKETNNLLIEIDSCNKLQNLKPDFEALYKSHKTIKGVLITSKSDKENYDFESRYFCPWSVANEDPVTGSTHTFLAKYWSTKLNKMKMNSFQCSERTGFMQVTITKHNTLLIKSNAKVIFEGNLNI